MIDRKKVAALAAVLALSACGGGGTTKSLINPIPPGTPSVGATQQAALRLVGIGDSLTAGEQSGQVSVGTQPNGFFSLMYAQANQNGNFAANASPATSVLPLIGPAGVPGQGSCLNGSAQAAMTQAGGLALRLNPSVTPYDVAIPGQTMSDAVGMIGPQATCLLPPPSALPGGTPAQTVAFAGLNSLIFGESTLFYPVLGTFGSNISQLQAAESLHPQAATVWLGSNELLKFIFSVGQVQVPSPGQFGQNLSSIISGLKANGTRAIAVANLVDVLHAALFVPAGSVVATLATQGAIAAGAPPGSPAFPPTYNAIAAQITPYVSAVLSKNGLLPSGYVMLPGMQILAAQLQSPSPQLVTFQAGQYVPSSVAMQAQALNDAYNATIGQVVAGAGSGVALVDIHTLLQTSPTIPGTNCCTAVYGGGLFSLDGIHPSNTGYAFLAQAFIGVFDTQLGQTIPPLSNAQIAQIYATDPYAPNPR